MRPQIIQKLNNLISKGITTEPEVYYLIGQSRKYLEQELPDRKSREAQYPTLSLFENWVLHSKLEGTGAQKKLREYSTSLLSKNGKREPLHFMTNISLFAESKVDLCKFCSSYDINSNFLKESHWKRFLRLLIGVLKDLPLYGGRGCYIKSFFIKNDDTKNLVTFVVNTTDSIHGEYQIGFDILSGSSPANSKK